MINIIAQIEVKANHINEFLDTANNLVKCSLQENGCISYNLVEVENSKNVFKFIEFWKSEKDIELHNSTSHFLNAIKTFEKITIKTNIEINNVIF